MQIKDQPNFKEKPKPYTFSPHDMVQKALDIMCEKNIGSIIAINPDNTVAGIVTERDMMIRVLGARKNPDTTPIADIMSTDLSIAKETDNLVNWMKTMSSKRFRHLPVVDKDDKLICMMSQGDFSAHTWPDLYDKVRQDIKGGLGRWFQTLLIVFALITLGLIALKL